MSVRLLIIRHGNTFEAGETPRRVGARTDLHLVESGREQARKIGIFLKENNLLPDVVYISGLKRTLETALLALAQAHAALTPQVLDMLTEIDYGPDENRTDEAVIARIGKEALEAWDKQGIVPPGWQADAEKIKNDWRHLAEHLQKMHKNQVVMVVTSNGIARFAPVICEDSAAITSFKVSTGSISLLEYNDKWSVTFWNKRP